MRRTHCVLILFVIVVAALVAASIAFGRPSRPDHAREASVDATLSLARPQNPVSREETFRLVPAATTTTTEPPTTTTTEPPRPVTTTTPPPAPAAAPPSDGDFWWRLGPGCESATDGGGNGGGFFQFSPDTAIKVGYQRGQSYAKQLAEAQDWASRIHPNEGSPSGWPHCWWQALAGG